MLKNIFILVLIIVGFSCSTPKNAPASRDIESIETTQDTIRIINEELEYEIEILDIGFESWLATQFPQSYYTNHTLAARNYLMVIEWNQRVMEPLRFDPMLYEQLIDYKPNIDYGMEVNYLLYMYFKFFQKKYHQRLGPFQP